MALTKVSYSMIQGAVFNILDFGASPTATPATNQACIQAAIDAANAAGGGAVYIPSGTYELDVVNYITDGGSVFGITSLKLLNNVMLFGDGAASVLKVKNSAYGAGAFYRMISSRDVTRLQNAKVMNLTLNGNKANQVVSAQCDNMLLEVSNTIEVNGVASINANGNGILIRGTTAAAAANIKVTNCSVGDCNTIGIQCSQFNGLIISNNYVYGTGDNCIDIYGEKGTTVSNGLNFTITGNTVFDGLVGIFCETVVQGVVTGNTVTVCDLGITVNRINGEPGNIIISSNVVTASPYGVRITGDTGGVTIVENTLVGCSIGGVVLGDGGTGSCSYVDVSHNYFVPPNTTVPCILTNGAQAAFITGRFNVINKLGMTKTYHFVNAATSSNVVNINSFVTLPYQVGPDLQATYASFSNAEFLTASADNISGTYDITPPDSTGGNIIVTSSRVATGISTYTIPYTKSGANLTLGTPQTTFVTGDPITGVTSVAGAARVALVGANTFLKWGFTYTPIY